MIVTRSGMSRRTRNRRRDERVVVASVLVVLAGAAAFFAYLTPREVDKPLVTVYMQADCLTCQRWMTYLASHGFRTVRGNQADWAQIRARFKLPAGFRGLHTGVVDGLYLEGHVPARDIRRVLNEKDHEHLKGLVVPGLPPGAPGLESTLPQPFVVYGVMEFGLLRPISTYER